MSCKAVEMGFSSVDVSNLGSFSVTSFDKGTNSDGILRSNLKCFLIKKKNHLATHPGFIVRVTRTLIEDYRRALDTASILLYAGQITLAKLK